MRRGDLSSLVCHVALSSAFSQQVPGQIGARQLKANVSDKLRIVLAH